MMAARGVTNAQDALLATSPPTQPLALMETSGRPKRKCVMETATRRAAPAASAVLIEMSIIRAGETPANKIAPAELSPSHPSKVKKQPDRMRIALCPGMA